MTITLYIFFTFLKKIKKVKRRVDTVDRRVNSLLNQRVTVPPFHFKGWQISRMQCSNFKYSKNLQKKFTNLSFDLGPPPRGGWYLIRRHGILEKGTLRRKGGPFHIVRCHSTMWNSPSRPTLALSHPAC